MREGIANMLYQPPGFVVREAMGLERFAERMRADGWDRELILRLPDINIPYWQEQARSVHRLLATIPFRRGERLLDIGANTCWASKIFAAHGLEVVALDISQAELQGLRTADYYLSEGPFFERVLSVMFDPALADESFDYVFCCEVLHHNDREGLQRTMRELYRVLRPGGRLLVVNEPLRFLLRPKLDHANEVAEFEGYEHVYFIHQYWRAVRAAGFSMTLSDLQLARRGGARSEDQLFAGRRSPLKVWLGSHVVGRRALRCYRVARFWWRHAIYGDPSLKLVGVKAR